MDSREEGCAGGVSVWSLRATLWMLRLPCKGCPEWGGALWRGNGRTERAATVVHKRTFEELVVVILQRDRSSAAPRLLSRPCRFLDLLLRALGRLHLLPSQQSATMTKKSVARRRRMIEARSSRS